MVMQNESQKSNPILANASPEEREAAIERMFAMADGTRRALEPKDFGEGMALAEVYAKAGLYGVVDKNVAFVVLQTGRELGLLAGQSFRAIYVLDGKPALYSAAKVALVRKSGLCAKWDVIESTADRCVIEVQRTGGKVTRYEWTRARADAVMQGDWKDGQNKGKPKPLTAKDVWVSHPTQMLRHRCESEVVDAEFQDVTLGLGTVEDMEREKDDVPPRTQHVDVAAKPALDPAPWIARFEKVATEAERKALLADVPVSLRDACKPANAAAKARLEQPKGDGPKPPTGGGAPAPAAASITEAVSSAAPSAPAATPATEASASPAELVAMWTKHLAGKNDMHAVANSHAAHIHEMPDEVHAACTEATERRMRALATVGADVHAILVAAVAKRAQKVAA